jgi:ATP-dependent Lon protease
VNDGYGCVLKIQFVRKEFAKKTKKVDEEKDNAPTLGTFTSTGRLGETMSESTEVVKIAVFNFLKQQQELGLIDASDFDKDSYHLHIPMGAIPKDGPSAGVSLFASLMSVATGRPVASNLAMTGEITTLGEVCTIGGVREKLTACKNHQITRVILPKSNQKHVKKLPEEFKKGFTIYYVNHISQLNAICFPQPDQQQQQLHSDLQEKGVTIEEYEEDDFARTVF